MTRQARLGVIIAGIALLVLGALLGLAPSSIMANGKDTSCGSPWMPDDSAVRLAEFGSKLSDAMSGGRGVAAGDYRSQCRDALGSRGTLGGIAAALGAAALLALAFVPRQRPEPEKQALPNS
ncbi:hypothetical protein [Allokutzneria albata]|nr:hypothetical protein [Allokutzneria albata]